MPRFAEASVLADFLDMPHLEHEPEDKHTLLAGWRSGLDTMDQVLSRAAGGA